MGSHTFKDEAAWHELRARHVGASEIAALFGLSPWQTRWGLYMIKAGKLSPPDLSARTAVSAGRFMEAGVGAWAAEKFGVTLNKVRRYLSDDECPGLGASLDFECVGSGVKYPVEIKFIQRHDGWSWEGDDLTLVPENYLLQIQVQLACSGAPFGELVAFIGGDIRRLRVPRSDKLIAAIRSEVTEFWDDVRSGKEPPPDYTRDADGLSDLAYRMPLREVILDAAHVDKFIACATAKAEAQKWKDAADALQAEITKLYLDNNHLGNDGRAVAVCGGWRLALTKVADNPGKTITADMVGDVIGKRAGHLRTTISEAKE